MPVAIVDHPLAQHLLTLLRDESTPPDAFRHYSRRLTTILAVEATRDLTTTNVKVRTPLEETEGRLLSETLVVVPILRAGLGMLEPIAELFTNVSVGYIGLERDETTAIATSYYCKLPKMDGMTVLLCDPMLATGGSAAQAAGLLRDAGARTIKMIAVVATPTGIDRLLGEHPETEIFTTSIDRSLDDRKYILPGLGDYGDRLYGTL
jgi:uracil phosphoribosyltransferase